MRQLLALLIGLVGFGVVSLASEQVALANPAVISEDVQNRFPDDLRFRIDLESNVEIAEVELRAVLLPDGAVRRTPARCFPDKGTRVSCNIDIGDDRFYIPPFTEIRYSWRVTEAGGATTDLPEKTTVYADTRFQWRETQSGNVKAYTYGNADGRQFAAVGLGALEKTGVLLNVTTPFPVKIVVYNTVPDMQAAQQRRSEAFSAHVTTLGQRVSSDIVLVLNRGDAMDTLRHEIAHVVTKVAGEAVSGSLPAWLDEGTAVYAQDRAGSGYESSFKAAVGGNRLLSIRSMTSATGNPALVDLFYGQSYYFVDYLVRTFGRDRFAELYAAIKRGASATEAVQQAYGKDLGTIENEWRASLGLPALQGGEERREAPISGTLAPLGSGASGGGGVATTAAGEPAGSVSAESDDRGGRELAFQGGIAVIAMLALSALAALALRRFHRRPRP